MDDNILDQKWSAGSLLRFAFPTIVMMIFMGLYTIVDTIFVAQFVNTDALSSINIRCIYNLPDTLQEKIFLLKDSICPERGKKKTVRVGR